MIQYKEKKKDAETGSLALLSYPVLMAADIFLYDADLVIVGQDQRQHCELTADIARFLEKRETPGLCFQGTSPAAQTDSAGRSTAGQPPSIA